MSVERAGFLLLFAAAAVGAILVKSKVRRVRSSFLTGGGGRIAACALALASALGVSGVRWDSLLWVVPIIGVVGGITFYLAERSGWLARFLRKRSSRRLNQLHVGTEKPGLEDSDDSRRIAKGDQ